MKTKDTFRIYTKKETNRCLPEVNKKRRMQRIEDGEEEKVGKGDIK